ncbi:hypothetical protein CY0110_16972 [Crocosphaera chwakensis CCY0110]|uniref:Uncharacterized protein n=1 Tax=Crocosphaera chwakensis CCY0110 TaxID=391612 RepID=A3II76_9CHRO|nr:hypothetical protein CY0110_16972 [Crocosphaera chwakensis CCY0110]
MRKAKRSLCVTPKEIVSWRKTLSILSNAPLVGMRSISRFLVRANSSKSLATE